MDKLIGLAPMEGVLDPLLRDIISAAIPIDYCTTEFVRVTDKVTPPHIFYKYAPELLTKSKTSSGTPLLVQLLGGKPEWMALNAEEAFKLGAYGIDLNFGCPAKTVNRHDGGAALLQKPERLYNVISVVKERVGKDKHVSAKIRLGFEDKSLVKEIATACSDAGATWITVHARTKKEGYKPPAHWHYIKEIKELSAVPVLANGDIWTLEDYKKCSETSGCSDVMIGRGLLRNPLLAQEIKANREWDVVEKQNHLINLMKTYLLRASELYGEEIACGRIKQWLKMASYPKQDFFEEKFHAVKRFKSAKLILKKL